VARLHLAADYDRMARDLGLDDGYTITYHLHPPVLRRLGMKRKLPMGRPYTVAFRALRGMRRLRGTPLDLFGLDPDRRTERALVEEFERLMTDALDSTDSTYEHLVALAASVASIRGYGPIKEQAVEAWRRRIADGVGAETGAGEPVGARE
jgi:indolepyruvate ferredoxin oxidoreductase